LTKPLNKISRARLPLFGKIVGGFIIVIATMVGFSVVILSRLNSVSTFDKSDYKTLLITQEMGEIIIAQRESAVKYLKSSNPNDLGLFNLLNQRFKAGAESLKTITDREETKLAIDSAVAAHSQYVEFLFNQIGQEREKADTNVVSVIQSENGFTEKINQRLSIIRESVVGSVTKSLKSLDQQTSDTIQGVNVIFWLGLGISLALAIIIATTLAKPIKALKAGTEKVGEGIYETVTVTTNDEVADLTRAFNLMSDKLKQLDEMRMQLMSEISHEMRTPLQIIKTGCYSIVRGKDALPLSQRQLDAVGMIKLATDRINDFVNSFLDIAKMEAGLVKFNFVSTDVVDLIDQRVRPLQLIAEARKITLTFKPEKIEPLPLDIHRFTQVIDNLINNALKYTPESGRIEVRVSEQLDERHEVTGKKKCIRIDVQDSGVGIPKADLEKLFQKFYQAKNTPLVNEKGSGLGLALVKHVAEAHGGSVSVASEVGVGSTFSVILPMS
jgi:signal transduction histidine kinase